MRAMFVAHGPFSGAVKDLHRRGLSRRGGRPGFHSVDKEAYVLDGFRNLEVYGLVMELLGVEGGLKAQNNGTDGFWRKYLD
jgi:hypothetical protein